MNPFSITLGIISCGRPKELAVLINSLELVDWTGTEAKIILINNKGRESCDEVIASIPAKYNPLIINLPNIGFHSAWNIVLCVSEAQHLLMLQDDVLFLTKCKMQDIIKYKIDNQIGCLRLNNTNGPQFNTLSHQELYSDQPNITDKKVWQTTGFFKAFPLWYDSMQHQAVSPEPMMQEEMKKIRIRHYPQKVAFHQDGNNSLIQTCFHNIDLSKTPEIREEIWRTHCFEKYNIKKFGE